MTNLFTDVDKNIYGADRGNGGADSADAVFVAAHGNYTADTLFYSSISVPYLSQAVSLSSYVALGDHDLDTLHVYGCGSTQWIDLNGDDVVNISDEPFRSWRVGGAWDGIGSIHGMHGTANISAWWFFGWHLSFPNGGTFSSLGDSESISEAWIDQMYKADAKPAPGGGYYDYCPMSFAFGATSSEALSYLNKQYDYNTFEDNPGGTQYVRVRYVSGCDPDNGAQLH